jgi:hypothetical protein
MVSAVFNTSISVAQIAESIAPVNEEHNATVFNYNGPMCVIAHTAESLAPVNEEHNATVFNYNGPMCVIA